MKKIALIIVALMLTGLFATVAKADTLSDIKKKGVLVAGVKDATPGFAFMDGKTGEIAGYDVDFARSIAGKLGVRLELKRVTSVNRIPRLMSGDVDIIAATMTKTPERAEQIDFSCTYFVTAQKFITKKGTVGKLADLDGRIIATTKGSTPEQNTRKWLPRATLVAFDDYEQAFAALREGKAFAVTTDESILAGILKKAADTGNYEIPDIALSAEPYGMGIRKGDRALLEFVNRTLVDMEKTGEAKAIFEKWFGDKSPTPLQRGFKIKAE